MCDSVFAIGPSGSYYFEAPSQWLHKNLPTNLANSFNVSREVGTVYCLVLGTDDSFLITYRGRFDNEQWRFSNGIPPALKTWVFNTPGINLSTLKITLGPRNGSWFGCDGTHASWRNIPMYLKDALSKYCWPAGSKSWLSIPKIVQLGVNDNYILITSNGAASWVLDSYPDLKECVTKWSSAKGNGLSVVHNLYLNPHQAGSFIVQGGNGATISGGIPSEASKDFQNIAEILKSDTDEADRVAMIRAQNQREVNRHAMDIYTAGQINQMNTMTNFYNNLANSFNNW